MLEKLLKSYQHIEHWNKGETSIYERDEYTIIEINSEHRNVKIEFRNVGSIHKDSSIQFSVTEYKKRSKSIYFSIPFDLAELFIERLGLVKPIIINP
jgi:hypothetical protein